MVKTNQRFRYLVFFGLKKKDKQQKEERSREEDRREGGKTASFFLLLLSIFLLLPEEDLMSKALVCLYHRSSSIGQYSFLAVSYTHLTLPTSDGV